MIITPHPSLPQHEFIYKLATLKRRLCSCLQYSPCDLFSLQPPSANLTAQSNGAAFAVHSVILSRCMCVCMVLQMADPARIQELKDIANKLRIHSVEQTTAAGSG